MIEQLNTLLLYVAAQIGRRILTAPHDLSTRNLLLTYSSVTARNSCFGGIGTYRPTRNGCGTPSPNRAEAKADSPLLSLAAPFAPQSHSPGAS